MSVHPVIVAGGQGLRMRPVNDRLPKSMLPVGGKPLLEHQVEWLKKSGFREAFLCLGYKADEVRRHFGDGARWGVRLDYQVEESPRGTAGAVRDLGARVSGDLLVIYGDLFIDMECRPLLEFHARHDAEGTLVIRETDHPHDSDLVRLEGDRVTAVYRARPGERTDNLACAAVWIVRPRLLERVPADEPSDFAKDIFPRCLAQGGDLRAYRLHQGILADIGTPERMEAFLRRREARR